MDIKDQFYHFALTFLHLPYRWGGDDPMAGLDCSGLIRELYFFPNLTPRSDKTAEGWYEFFKAESYRGIRKLGALAFYGADIDHISHVAMFLDDTRIIEAGGGNRSTTNLDMAIKQNAFVRIRPFDRRTDLVAVLAPERLPW
jgi:cell wall-associated NlpC family hydrolase